MLYKFVFFLMVAAAVTMANPTLKRSTSPFEFVNEIILEEPCVKQGGLCLRIEDCEPDNLVWLGDVLCPMQRHLGVQCCYH